MAKRTHKPEPKPKKKIRGHGRPRKTDGWSVRACMKCGKPFHSEHRFHRMCDTCKHAGDGALIMGGWSDAPGGYRMS